MTASIPMNDKTCVGGRFWNARAALPVFLYHEANGTLSQLIGIAGKAIPYKEGGGLWPLQMKLNGTTWTSMQFNTGTVEQAANAHNTKYPKYKPHLLISKFPRGMIEKTAEDERVVKSGITDEDAHAIVRIAEIIDKYVFETLLPQLQAEDKIIIGAIDKKKQRQLKDAPVGSYVHGQAEKIHRFFKADEIPLLSFGLVTDPPGKMPKTSIKYIKHGETDKHTVNPSDIDKDMKEEFNQYLPMGAKTKSNVEFSCIAISPSGISVPRSARSILSHLPPPFNSGETGDFSDEEEDNGEQKVTVRTDDDTGDISSAD